MLFVILSTQTGHGEIEVVVHQHRNRYINGGSSTRKAGKRIAIGIPALTPRQSVNGGNTSCWPRYLMMDVRKQLDIKLFAKHL